jgi:Flp pilus assembly protein TadB
MANFLHLVLALCLALFVMGALSYALIPNTAAIIIMVFALVVFLVYWWADRRSRRR